ncbi:ribonuclease T2-like [Tropilaelaps mercedesae]|uniref:Ribonuclease T2-like n=1 Tax=Tropilaelaps mercedesae TaxID=418985 RepID=A0A1V9Y2E9_9ACAR|nr:ribonuclease T2-like [Tropilaelaps mercedesae]
MRDNTSLRSDIAERMQRWTGLLLALFALAALLDTASSDLNCTTKPFVFDVFKLALHSRGGYCELKSCEKLDTGKTYPHPPLTIQGLWPAWSNGSNGPMGCSYVEFSNNSVKLIKDQLDYLWPSFDSYIENQDLWSREVQTYGSCALCQEKDLGNGTNYLMQALILYKSYNVTAWLEKGGIAHSYHETIALSRINETLTKSFDGGEFELYCEGSRDGKDILQGVRLCFSANKQTPTKCVKTRDTCTTPDVWYLGSSSGSVVPSTLSIFFATYLVLLFLKH